jgi:hypothetical protein
MTKKKQEFMNYTYPDLRDELYLRRNIVWSLDLQAEKPYRGIIPDIDNRWKKEKNAIKLSLKKNWPLDSRQEKKTKCSKIFFEKELAP